MKETHKNIPQTANCQEHQYHISHEELFPNCLKFEFVVYSQHLFHCSTQDTNLIKKASHS